MRRKVKDVMTKDPVVAREWMPFKEVAYLMEWNDVGALPVLDDLGRLVGIVSEADLLLKEERTGTKPKRFAIGRRRRERAKADATTARELMTTPAVTVDTDAAVGEAARRMHAAGVKRLPVVDKRGVLVGIVSRKDLLSVFLRPDGEIQHDVEEGVLHHAMWLTPADGDIHVGVEQGVVRLSGWVERKSLIEIITAMVLGVDGVVDVDNQLGFRTDDTHIKPETSPAWGVLPYALRRP